MRIFIKGYEYDLWASGDLIPTLKIEPKLRSEYTKVEAGRVAKNYRALNILFCGLDTDVNHVATCDTAKEI